MSSIENTTIPISKAAIIIVAVCGFIISCLGSYFAAMNGVKDGFTEIKLEFKDVHTELKIQAIRMDGLQKSSEFHYSCINDLQEAMKPEEPKLKKYNHHE